MHECVRLWATSHYSDLEHANLAHQQMAIVRQAQIQRRVTEFEPAADICFQLEPFSRT